jgi:hypothetical protein
VVKGFNKLSDEVYPYPADSRSEARHLRAVWQRELPLTPMPRKGMAAVIGTSTKRDLYEKQQAYPDFITALEIERL